MLRHIVIMEGLPGNSVCKIQASSFCVVGLNSLTSCLNPKPMPEDQNMLKLIPALAEAGTRVHILKPLTLSPKS